MTKILLSFAVLAIFLIPNIANAMDITMISNTDRCIYQMNIDKDYCQTIYKISNLSNYQAEKLRFQFKTDKMSSFLPQVSGSDATISVKKTANIYLINISAYKNPFLNIDNVPCYDNDCFYKWAWWNSSFPYKYGINGTTYLGTYGGMVLVNDTFVLFNETQHLIWCNFTVINHTQSEREIIGYLYFQSNDTFACVNAAENARVPISIDEGLGSQYSWPGDDLVYWGNFSGSGDDASKYRWTPVKTGTITPNSGIVGQSMNFNLGYYLYGDHQEHDGISRITVMGWFRGNGTGVLNVMAAKCKAGAGTDCGWDMITIGATMYWSLFVAGSGYSQPTAPFAANAWTHYAGTWDGDKARIYINGVLYDVHDPVGTELGVCAGEPLGMGYSCDNKNGLVGQMDDVRIYNRSLSDAEIMAVYNNTNGTHRFTILTGLYFNESQEPGEPPETNITSNVTTYNLSVLRSFCMDNDYLFVSEPCVSNCSSFRNYLKYCPHGCSNNTYLGLGEPGCIENPFLLAAIGLVAIVLFLALALWLGKK